MGVAITPVSCYGGNTGSISISASGGSPSKTYIVNGNSNSNPLFSGLSAGMSLGYRMPNTYYCRGIFC